MNIVELYGLQINPNLIGYVSALLNVIPTIVVILLLLKLKRIHHFILLCIYLLIMFLSVITNRDIIGVTVAPIFFGLLFILIIRDYIYETT